MADPILLQTNKDKVKLGLELVADIFTTGESPNVAKVVLTNSQILAITSNGDVQTLDVSMYPSLDELKYVKGVSSSIQSQFTNTVKQSGIAYLYSTFISSTLSPRTNDLNIWATDDALLPNGGARLSGFAFGTADFSLDNTLGTTRVKTIPDNSNTDDTLVVNQDFVNNHFVPKVNPVFSGPVIFPKAMITPTGGIAVRLTNRTGNLSVKGEVVMVNSSADNSVSKLTVDSLSPIGVFYEDGIVDGGESWVVVSGIADVYYIGNTTRGHMARGFVTGDAGYVPGRALSEVYPVAPSATDKHFCEIGHVLESRTGAGLAKTILHFN